MLRKPALIATALTLLIALLGLRQLASEDKPRPDPKKRLAAGEDARIRIADEVVGATPEKKTAALFTHPSSIGDTQALLANFGKVEAFRVSPYIDLTAEATFAGYRVVSGPTEFDAKLAKELVAAVRDPKVYDWTPGGGSFCGFAPGIAIRFSEKQRDPTEKPERVVIFFCFTCNELAVHFSHTEYKNLADFEPGRARLVRLMKQVFPNDKAIQALTEKTFEEPPEDHGLPFKTLPPSG